MATINWDLCIICQKVSSEKLRCPVKCSGNLAPVEIYNAFLENFNSFKDLGALPVKVDYGESVTAQVFMQNNASWHKRCHQKFNTSMLECAKKGQKRKGSSDEGHTACRPKRKPNSMSTTCIFCGDVTTELLHEFTAFNMDKAIRDMANEMSNSDMLVQMSGGVDLVAIEGKYHLSCLTNYRNRYRAFLRAQPVTSQSSISSKQAKARAFAELVMYIESAIEEGTHGFKLAELHTAYESSLINFSANRTRLKVELLEHFQECGIQEQTDGKKTLFYFFPKGCIPF